MDTLTALIGIRHEIYSSDDYRSPTKKQRNLLASLMSQALSDSNNRVSVLREITGLPRIDGSRNLTRGTVSVLIDFFIGEEIDGKLFISDDGRRLIEYVESRVGF